MHLLSRGGQNGSRRQGGKKTAREMMAMQAAINKESFRGQLQVTCFSCTVVRNVR